MQRLSHGPLISIFCGACGHLYKYLLVPPHSCAVGSASRESRHARTANATPCLNTEFNESQCRFSPDGRCSSAGYFMLLEGLRGASSR